MDHLKGIKVIRAFVLLGRCFEDFFFALKAIGASHLEKIHKTSPSDSTPSNLGRSLHSAKLIRSRMTGRKSGSEVGVW